MLWSRQGGKFNIGCTSLMETKDMFIIKKIKDLFVRIEGFFQYHYFSFMRNYYPCKLVGERRLVKGNEITVIYHKSGHSIPFEKPIKKLLSDYNLISFFNPDESLKIGFIAFEEFIFEEPHEERMIKFNAIKSAMLNSNYDTKKSFNFSSLFSEKVNAEYKENYVGNLHKNTYPCRLVLGNNCNKNNETTITYTLFGKRDGYEIKLRELILNKELLIKFHPTDAVKFGFIYMGDVLFEFHKISNK